MAMVYDPVSDLFQVYLPAKVERVELKMPSLYDEPFDISSWASRVTDEGVPVPKNNLTEDLRNPMIENSEQKTYVETPDTEVDIEPKVSSDNYVSGNFAKKFKGDKQLLESTIKKLNDPNISKIKGFLLDTAALESGFKYNITSKASTGSGWFGFLDSTKKHYSPGISRNDFNNSPEIQVKAASKLYYDHLRTALKLGMIDAAKKKGYSTDDVIHAMWLNPTWAKNFFLYGQEGGKDAFGTNIRKYLNKIHGRK